MPRLAPALRALVAVAPLCAGAIAAGPAAAVTLGSCLPDTTFEGYSYHCRVPVPLEAADPSQGTIVVTALVEPAAVGQPARPPLVIYADGSYFPRGNVVDDGSRDIVLIAARGTGPDEPLICAAQSQAYTAAYTADFIAGCASDLGTHANDYGADAQATDIEAVRQTLGIDGIDLIGGDSNDDLAPQLYANQFGSHVRSLTLVSPLPVAGGDPFSITYLHGELSTLADACGRGCPWHGKVPAELAAIDARVSATPIAGRASGVPGHPATSIDEQTLLVLLYDAANRYNIELPAAAEAALHGDTAPILRLAGTYKLPSSAGTPPKPTDFSLAQQYAAGCRDWSEPYDFTAPVAVRRQQYQAALAAVPPASTAPFSPSAWARYWVDDICIEWPAPSAALVRPVTPVATVPTLVIADTPDPEDAIAAAATYPGSAFVRLAPADSGDCRDTVIAGFLASLSLTPSATACASKNVTVPASFTISFPRTYAAVTAATPLASHVVGSRADRHLAAAIARTVQDLDSSALFIKNRGVGLRGGTAVVASTSARLHDFRFVSDLGLTGTVKFLHGNKLGLDLETSGVVRAHVKLTIAITGYLRADSAAVTGTINGRRVAARVPAEDSATR